MGGVRPGEPLVGQIVRFAAHEDARPTNFLAELYRCPMSCGLATAEQGMFNSLNVE